MGAAFRAFPGERRNPQRERDAEQPLEAHQAGEQPIRPAMDVVLILGKELVRTACNRSRECCHDLAEANNEQPNTLVDVVAGETWLSRSTRAERPGLSPAWPRAPVMP